MGLLILGLILFLGGHSLRIVADARRAAWVHQLGEKRFKLIYALVSIVGFVVLCLGFAQSKLDPVLVWSPPAGMRHLASLFVLLASILVVAAYVPRNHLKVRLGHPMYAGVKLWALAHLLANGLLAEMVLFGAFLIWSVLGFRAGRRRDRLAREAVHEASAQATDEQQLPDACWRATAITVALGLGFFAAFAFGLHLYLFGVRPFG